MHVGSRIGCLSFHRLCSPEAVTAAIAADDAFLKGGKPPGLAREALGVPAMEAVATVGSWLEGAEPPAFARAATPPPKSFCSGSSPGR